MSAIIFLKNISFAKDFWKFKFPSYPSVGLLVGRSVSLLISTSNVSIGATVFKSESIPLDRGLCLLCSIDFQRVQIINMYFRHVFGTSPF